MSGNGEGSARELATPLVASSSMPAGVLQEDVQRCLLHSSAQHANARVDPNLELSKPHATKPCTLNPRP